MKGGLHVDELVNWNDITTYKKLNNYVRSVELEKEKRKAKISKPQVVHYQPVSTKDLFLVPPGTVSMFYSANAKFLNDVIEAFSRDDLDLVSTLQKYIQSDFLSREYKSLDDINNMIDKNKIVELNYGSKVLSDGIIMPEDLEFLIMHFPFNGGKLDYAEFKCIEWYTNTQTPENLDKNCVLIIRPPELTEAEVQAFNMLPPDQYSVNIGPLGSQEAIPGFVVTALLFAAAMNTPFVGGCFKLDAVPEGEWQCGFIDKMNRIKNAEEMIASLGPYASANHLTSIRARILSSEL